STSGLYGNFGQCNYGAAKAGIAGFARCLWPEAQRKGITVNVIAPAAVTRMTEDLPFFQRDGGAGESMRPEHVSPVVVFLAGPKAESITGRVFLVFGNTVKLIEPTAIPIAEGAGGEPWAVAAIGEKILETVGSRPHPSWIERF
ncbi:MAG: SDR family oxidoreductase, partial [Myxococcales bacterium]|nr:SDR family oxidoreductase [Myxococcales bacterium]